MKSKFFSKRLVLNKKTIVNLGKPEMDEVIGGTSTHCTSYVSAVVRCPYATCHCIPSEPPLCYPNTD
ncbi:MAG: hypothetical protein GTO45_29165 [Candidatus Aminicenantes bacterium]|nr:hypothetical protein [Candidatus Aminicenantes bacterium]NIM82863.1 hypothetical protein [Candidatus Aminicenantes bacterium]NIN22239.1 hypothetical protein [Candidatus Aminicenantes bacterium]NIN46007.1 hypothetical protein [Candidatus Aminicenantes bacterium]NIN88843.1 hypothetical protein [Candidatus Aminicenantes bacterium]